MTLPSTSIVGPRELNDANVSPALAAARTTYTEPSASCDFSCVPAAFETHNPGTLLRRLREWDVRPDFVVGPMNPCGLGMKPSEAETLAELAQTPVPFLATELRASGLCELDAGARYARGHGAHGLAPDLSEMDEVAVDLRRLGAGAQV